MFLFHRYIGTSFRFKFTSLHNQINNNMSFTFTRNSNKGKYGGAAATPTPFCKVCYDAGLPKENFTSHFVKDQPGPSGKVVCPTLLAQKCLICGVPGHTSSYCPDNSYVSSSSTLQRSNSSYRMALATDEVSNPSYAIRLPPIDRTSSSSNPRIVYASDIHQPKTNTNASNASDQFPSLPNLSSLRRFENDEPLLRRGLPSPPLAEASPVHSPKKCTQVKYNKKGNSFGDLITSCESDESDVDEMPPVKEEQKKLPSSSWASIAAGKSTNNKPLGPVSKQSQRTRSHFSIVIPTAISAGPLLPPLLPPISFKPKPVSTSEVEKKRQVKKLWGDTDSEDDEEFLRRGLVQVGEKTWTLPEP